MIRAQLEKKGSHTKEEWLNKKKEFDNCCCICGIPEDLISLKILSQKKQNIRELQILKRQKEKILNNKKFIKSFRNDLRNNIKYYSELIDNFPKFFKKEIKSCEEYLEKIDNSDNSTEIIYDYIKNRRMPYYIDDHLTSSTMKFVYLNSEINEIEIEIEKIEKKYAKKHYQKLQKDHIKEVQELGYVWNDIENIQPTCVFCNHEKGWKTKLQLYIRQNQQLKNIIYNFKLKKKI